MKKITFVRRLDTLFGGAENYLKRLMKELESRGVKIELLHFSQPNWLVSWIKLPLYNYQACRAKKDKFYFSNDRLSCLEIYRAGGGTHKSFLKTKGFSLNPLHPIYIWMEKKTFKNSKMIIANSKMVKKDIIVDYGISPDKIELIYNGIEIPKIDEKELKSTKKGLLAEFNLTDNKNIILYVGSGFERKGVKEFLEILSNIKSDFYSFVVGKEKKITKYKKLAEKLGLEKKVIFTGSRKDVDRFYASADIFLFPTHYEPFPNVILEAMSFYNVVLTTKRCGASEILEDVPVMESPKDFSISKFIDEVLSDDKRLVELKSKNREISKKYSIKRNVDETIKLIKKVQSENLGD